MQTVLEKSEELTTVNPHSKSLGNNTKPNVIYVAKDGHYKKQQGRPESGKWETRG